MQTIKTKNIGAFSVYDVQYLIIFNQRSGVVLMIYYFAYMKNKNLLNTCLLCWNQQSVSSGTRTILSWDHVGQEFLVVFLYYSKSSWSPLSSLPSHPGQTQQSSVTQWNLPH